MFFNARVQEGRFLSSKIGEYLKTLKDGEYIVEIKKATRSNSQNRLYWSILEQIGKETGMDKDELHEFFKGMFLKCPVLTVLGEYTYIPSTAVLDKEQFTDYIDKICLFCSEQGFTILLDII